MTDQTIITPFERRLTDALDAYTAGIVDPTPTFDVATAAMAAGRRAGSTFAGSGCSRSRPCS